MDEGLGRCEEAAGPDGLLLVLRAAGSLSASHTITIEREAIGARAGDARMASGVIVLNSLYHKQPPRETVLRPSSARVLDAPPPPPSSRLSHKPSPRPAGASKRAGGREGMRASVCSFLRGFCCTSRGSEAIACSSAAYVSARAATLRGLCLGLWLLPLLEEEETSNVRLRLSPIMPSQTYYVT